MNRIVLKTLILLLTSIAFASQADAQILKKRPKKLNAKALLAIERQRTDSLSSLVEEYRRRESDWQKAWYDQKEEKKENPRKVFTVDYTPAKADSLAEQLKLQQVDDALQNFFNDYVCEPTSFSSDASLDSLYTARLNAMVSPIHLPYNELVRSYIKRYTDGSGLMSRVLALAQYYFPMIEEELLKAGLPVELRAMAIIESALQATVVSRAGASGLWQFMPVTARAYGLEVNSMVDERFDPYKATKAACKYMKDLYKMYNDWSLAIAAYNCGPGNVNKALARAGGNPQSFWDVYWYLPSETRGYVPAFIAANYAYAYHQAHNITYSEPPMPIAVDTIQVSRLLHLGQVSSTIDVTTDALKMLNPQYKLDVIPATNKNYTLILPANRVTDYITRQDSIFAKDSVYLKEYLNPGAVAKKMTETTTIYYRVKKGDTLGAIAKRYRVTTKQLMTWNRLKSANRLSIGQRLRIEKR
ncbi:MAG: transglycosylase SLT domain-containing protein [Alistipes sp.]|nr:LysM peptidoglycan-binding domain-containing protein [Rikenellaceae bacterium]MBQ7787381.1 transglycosylase SLT domain-containing protein [Alistipes sp.]